MIFWSLTGSIFEFVLRKRTLIFKFIKKKLAVLNENFEIHSITGFLEMGVDVDSYSEVVVVKIESVVCKKMEVDQAYNHQFHAVKVQVLEAFPETFLG